MKRATYIVLFIMILFFCLNGRAFAQWTFQNIDSVGTSSSPSIAVDSNDKLHISYTNGNDEIKYATNKEGYWSLNSVDYGQFADPRCTDIAVDSNNKTHIVYDFSYSPYSLKYATNKSGSWQTTILEEDVVTGWENAVAVDSNNKVHIAYRDMDSGDNLSYFTNKSGRWVKELIDVPGSVGRYPSIAIDSNNKVHISYYDEGNNDLKYATDVGGSWNVSVVDSIGHVGDHTSIAVDSDNKVHISYCGDGNVKYASNASGDWQKQSIEDEYCRYTSIAVDADDKIHIGYYVSISAYGIRYATNVSGSWETFIIKEDLTISSFDTNIAMAVDSNNSVYMVYPNYDTEQLELATYLAPPPPPSIPNAPSSLLATPVSTSSINLAWRDKARNEQGFKIERKDGDCDSSNPWVEITTLMQNMTNYVDSALPPDTEYAYRVKAFNDIGDSEYSTCSSSTTYATPTEPVNEGTIGTRLNIVGSGFGAKKGKVLIGDAKTSITMWTDTYISAVVKKALPLNSYPVYVITKSSSNTLPSTFTVMNPSISSIVDDHGSPLTPITIYGRFFGTKKGKVYLEYLDGSKTKKKNCKVNDWRMDELTGASEITFLVPKTSKSFLANTYTLKVINKVGTSNTTFTVD